MEPRDVLPIALACMLLATVAVLASPVPAWRAARVEPLTALHTQYALDADGQPATTHTSFA